MFVGGFYPGGGVGHMLKMQVKIFQKNKKRRKHYDKRFRTVELDFVSEGKLKYPGVNSKLFGNNIQVETEDEARNRLLQRIYEKYDAKHLTEYTAELSRYLNPEDLLENRDFFYEGEDKDMLKKVAAELISRHQEFAEMAEAEKMAVEKEKAEKEKAKKDTEHAEYIRKLSAAREVLVKEAHDAGFDSLRTYLMFLNIFGNNSCHASRGKVTNDTFKERFGVE